MHATFKKQENKNKKDLNFFTKTCIKLEIYLINQKCFQNNVYKDTARLADWCCEGPGTETYIWGGSKSPIFILMTINTIIKEMLSRMQRAMYTDDLVL